MSNSLNDGGSDKVNEGVYNPFEVFFNGEEDNERNETFVLLYSNEKFTFIEEMKRWFNNTQHGINTLSLSDLLHSDEKRLDAFFEKIDLVGFPKFQEIWIDPEKSRTRDYIFAALSKAHGHYTHSDEEFDDLLEKFFA